MGDLIAGVGAATKTFAPGGKHPRAATARIQLARLVLLYVTLRNDMRVRQHVFAVLPAPMPDGVITSDVCSPSSSHQFCCVINN